MRNIDPHPSLIHIDPQTCCFTDLLRWDLQIRKILFRFFLIPQCSTPNAAEKQVVNGIRLNNRQPTAHIMPLTDLSSLRCGGTVSPLERHGCQPLFSSQETARLSSSRREKTHSSAVGSCVKKPSLRYAFCISWTVHVEFLFPGHQIASSSNQGKSREIWRSMLA